jgi:hypothetical protein
MKLNHQPWPSIREELLNLAHDMGHSDVEEMPTESGYKLAFHTGDLIIFDGENYDWVRSPT